MGPVLIIVGLVVLIFLSFWIGLILMVVGLILTFVPGSPYGYGWYRGRHGPPPP